mmetsp:Transcript_32594/g.92402  ORF Transcript_32594/g.92402 Transcript_32594/m.92402 type:complete len:226 (+) Transcript_32594:1312-1989(+)
MSRREAPAVDGEVPERPPHAGLVPEAERGAGFLGFGVMKSARESVLVLLVLPESGGCPGSEDRVPAGLDRMCMPGRAAAEESLEVRLAEEDVTVASSCCWMSRRLSTGVEADATARESLLHGGAAAEAPFAAQGSAAEALASISPRRNRDRPPRLGRGSGTLGMAQPAFALSLSLSRRPGGSSSRPLSSRAPASTRTSLGCVTADGTLTKRDEAPSSMYSMPGTA